MFDSGWADGLDDAQLAAVEHDHGPLIVVAGAGTGKTRTLTARVARLLDTGWHRSGYCSSPSPVARRRR